MEYFNRLLRAEAEQFEGSGLVDGLAKIAATAIRGLHETGTLTVLNQEKRLAQDMMSIMLGVGIIILQDPELIKKYLPEDADIYIGEADKLQKKIIQLRGAFEEERK